MSQLFPKSQDRDLRPRLELQPSPLSVQNTHSFFASLQRDQDGFLRIAGIVKRLSGINLPLSEKNLSLLASRLAAVLAARQVATYGELATLVSQGDHHLAQEVVEAITTNTTAFFREEGHFQYLSRMLPDLLEQKRKTGTFELRLWCSAASTGQEPYTMAIQLHEALPQIGATWQVKFLATDIDSEVLTRAALGCYTEQEIASVPRHLRQKYFTRVKGQRHQVRRDLRQLVRFAQLNLAQSSYLFQHKFDIIFCRNVLIYFDRDLAARVVRNLAAVLAPGGYLFLGHSESGIERPSGLVSVASAVWQKVVA